MSAPLRLIFLFLSVFLVACGPRSTPAPPESAGPLKVQKLEAQRDGDRALVRITLDFTNQTNSPVVARAEAISLLTDSEIIPAFTRPFNEYPNVAPGATVSATLEYWAEARQLSGALRLKYLDQSLAVKDATEFKIEQLPEKQMVILSWPKWQHP